VGKHALSDHRPGLLAIKLASIRLLLPVGRARNVGHRHAVVDRLAADRFRLRFLLGRIEHFERDVARNEADAGVIGPKGLEAIYAAHARANARVCSLG